MLHYLKNRLEEIFVSIEEDGLRETTSKVLSTVLHNMGDFRHELSVRAYLQTRQASTMTPFGIRISMENRSPIERDIARGEYKNHLVQHFRDTVRNRQLKFADVGSNIGLYSIMHDTLSRGDNVIDAFEPVPENLVKLQSNVRLNQSRNVSIHSCAIGDTNGEVVINSIAGRAENATIAPESWGGLTFSHSLRVQQRTLDSIYEGSMPPDIIQIDAEGAEIKVLRGARELLQEHRPIVYVVLHPKLVYAVGDSIHDMSSILEDAGYSTVYDVEEGEYGSVPGIPNGLDENSRAKYYYLSSSN